MRHRAHQVDLGIPHPESLLGHPHDTKPSFEAFFERLTRNFTGEDIPKGEHPESLTLDVLLSPLEAMAGCAIPVEVPRFHRCPQCAGSGDVLPFRCASCGGSGQIEEVRELLIEVQRLSVHRQRGDEEIVGLGDGAGQRVREHRAHLELLEIFA